MSRLGLSLTTIRLLINIIRRDGYPRRPGAARFKTKNGEEYSFHWIVTRRRTVKISGLRRLIAVDGGHLEIDVEFGVASDGSTKIGKEADSAFLLEVAEKISDFVDVIRNRVK